MRRTNEPHSIDAMLFFSWHDLQESNKQFVSINIQYTMMVTMCSSRGAYQHT